MKSKLFELENLDAEVRRCTRGKATLINDNGKQYIKYHVGISASFKYIEITDLYIPVENEDEIMAFCKEYARLFDIPMTISVYVVYDNQSHTERTFDDVMRLYESCYSRCDYTDLFDYLKAWTPEFDPSHPITYPFRYNEMIAVGAAVNNTLYPESGGLDKNMGRFLDQLSYNSEKCEHLVCGNLEGRLSRFCRYNIEYYLGCRSSAFTIDADIVFAYRKEFLSRGGGTIADKYFSAIDDGTLEKKIRKYLLKHCKELSEYKIRSMFLDFIKHGCTSIGTVQRY
jgi:hypothetical protein